MEGVGAERDRSLAVRPNEAGRAGTAVGSNFFQTPDDAELSSNAAAAGFE